MNSPFPFDIRQKGLSNDAETLKFLRDVLYKTEDRSYLSWINPLLCEEVRRYIADKCAIPLELVIVVGSARLGFSTKNGLPFEIGFSDLDIAVVSAHAFKVANQLNKVSEDHTEHLPIRPSQYIDHPLFHAASMAARQASRIWSAYFSSVSIAVYPSMDAVSWRTAVALRKWHQLMIAAPTVAMPLTCGMEYKSLDKIIDDGFSIICGKVEDSSPLASGPYVISYETTYEIIGAMGNRGGLINSLNQLLEKLGDYLKPEVMMIGGSVLVRDVAMPRDVDCVLFYSLPMEVDTGNNLNEAMRWVRKYRQEGVDMRLCPTDGPKWLSLKFAGYMATLFSMSKTGRSQGPIIVPLD